MGDVEPALTASEVARIVRGVEPSAFVVPGRIVRRAIQHDRGLPTLRWKVPHGHLFVIEGAAARGVVDREELGLGADEAFPPTLILIAEPEPDELADRARGAILRDYWRRLFHARVHVELDRKIADGTIDAVGLRERIAGIGPSAFEEARSVLRADDQLLPPITDPAIYVEFAASYLGLRAFSDYLTPRFYPAIQDPAAVERLLAEDVDAAALLASTRLEGSADCSAVQVQDADEPRGVAESEPGHEAPSGPEYRRLMAKAERAEERGNLVRGAILRTQASRLAGSSLAGQARSAARDAMDRLAARLKAALEFDDATLREWRKALVAPLARSSRGFWTPEARLLYDLQKACVDHERPVFAVDVFRWAFSAGRRPIKRLLPHHQEVLIVQHLRGAAKHLTVARLPDPDRVRFTRLLAESIHRAERRLRDRFRPEIGKVLEQTGFEARNLPERVALQKINEELLDRVVHHGYLAMGDLRDALSRNNRKLPDLAGPVEFVAGDRLILANERLAVALDGVYRRGEIYLRVLQRLSSVAFGTPVGRFLTRYLAIPYGGAFLALEGLKHVVEPVVHLFNKKAEVEILTRGTFLFVGTLFLLLIASSDFRTLFGRGLRKGYDLAHGVVVGVPRWVLDRDWVRRLLASWTFRLIFRALVVPLALSASAWAIRPAYVDMMQAETASALVFLATFLLLMTRAGRNLEELALDSLGRGWDWFFASLLPGLFRLVMETFARVMEAVERVLYTVDEWLRFRSGQGGASLLGKAILAMAWFVIAYVVRFVVTLLVEPQINPIKHFPVVTVSHKIMLTQLFRVEALMTPLFGKELGPPIALTVLGLIPGIFGFLVWELKENWKLYEANRPKGLKPVVIGHHGETMAQLLKPGFHSGTVPKLFAKIRRAERKKLQTGHGKALRKQLAHLHSVEEEVRHFVDRDFLALLAQSRSMGGMPLAIGELIPNVKRFLVEVVRPGRGGPGLWLAFEEHSGWLVAGIVDPGWLAELPPGARGTFVSALVGLYKMAGVQLIREPIIDALGPDFPDYDLRQEGLVVWPTKGSPTEILYLLRPVPGAPPLVTIDAKGQPALTDPPQLDSHRLLFSNAVVGWKGWVELWEDDRSGKDLPEEMVPGLRFLPKTEGSQVAD